MTATQLPRRRRASISDVARLAGVSVGTVSNVLNRPEHVAERTRTRVEQAIEELSFVRNASARQLREGSVRTVGAVLLDVANPFFTEMARGVEDRLTDDDYALMLGSSDEDPDREKRFLRLFEEHGVHGMLVTPTRGSTLDALLRLRDRGVQVVLLDHRSPEPTLPSVAVDDVQGAALATRHLLGQGHERIAFLNGPARIRQCVDRHDGVRTALVEAGRDPADSLVEITLDALNASNGAQGMARLLDLPGPPVTATFCVNDFTALGALRCLRQRGLQVPEDMAMVGYDDVVFASELLTPLTSVRQPTHELGWRAADLLLGDQPPEQLLFQPELVVRASSVTP
ncbi:LacI family DNA-binding transcriptional regulator [Georgenia sp. H159]|uniref:LacI family DNA-binding transcriptional regulator n=1 Tax=Georgenia sp. H159 TaxID=3076115 RepID=UPI002D76E3BB|nr:LacI family DNA-binding transcriptional regulator [Georgenia sp. H159]